MSTIAVFVVCTGLSWPDSSSGFYSQDRSWSAKSHEYWSNSRWL